MLGWRFIHAKNLSVMGMNHGGEDRFSEDKYKSLAREVIQNSLDAHNKKLNQPVRVEFDRFYIDNAKFPGIEYLKNESLRKAKNYKRWQESEDTREYLKNIESVLDETQIAVLRVSDYNTTGLNEKQYESIISEGYGVKSENDSQGSKGIGKAAPFVNSSLRTVFYNTSATESGDKSVGIIHFVSYPVSEDQSDVTEARGMFVQEGQDYIEKQTTFGDYSRNEPGTDLFIMGFDEEEDWENELLHSILYNYLLSIYQEKVIVKIGEILINKKSLGNILNRLEGYSKKSRKLALEYEEIFRYYKVLSTPEGEDKKEIHLSESFLEKYSGFIKNPEDGILMILRDEEGTRSILQTRNVGMRINTIGLEKSIGYTAIFQARGKLFNQFLKDMESAAHDKWTCEQKTIKKGNKTKAKNLITDLRRFYKESIRESFGETDKDGVKAYGLGEFLAIEKEGEKDKTKDSGIKRRVQKAKKNKESLTNKLKTKEDDDKALISAGLETSEGIENLVDKDNKGGSNPYGGDGKRGGNAPGILGNDEGTKNEFGEQSDKKNKAGSKHKKQVIIPYPHLKVKIQEIDFRTGKYKLVGKTLKKADSLLLKLSAVGADGSLTDLNLTEVSSNINSVGEKSGEILINSVKKDGKIDLFFSLTSRNRMKMEVEVDEIKG